MRTNPHPQSIRLLLCLLSLAATTRAFAQEKKLPTPAEVTRDAAKTEEKPEEVLELSPFVVVSENDQGYAAKDTLAGTRIRTELKDVGASISIITPKFLEDTASTNIEQMFVYTTDVEVNGQGGNFLGRGDGQFLTSTDVNQPSNSTRVRGLDSADASRNFFLTAIPLDSYNVGRIDVQRGPNSILFGIGSPAGIYNSSLNVAAFKNANKIQTMVGSFGTARGTLNLNRVLLPNELALHIDFVEDHTKYRQDPAYKNSRRLYGTTKWDPKILARGTAHTSLSANFETGRIDGNSPRSTPPGDSITAYFNDSAFSDPTAPGGRRTYDTYPAITTGSTGPNPWLGTPGNRVFGGIVTQYDRGQPFNSFIGSARSWPTGAALPAPYSTGNPMRGIVDFATYKSNLPLVTETDRAARRLGAWKSRSLTDASIFDFYDNLLDGDNKHEYVRFHAFNVALAQTFFNQKAGFELAYDSQYVRNGNYNFISQDAANITIDITRTLPDGTPNPGVGRPMVIANGGSGGVGNYTRREVDSARAQMFAEFNVADWLGKESKLGRIFGRNLFTGLLARQETEAESRRYIRWHLNQSFAPNAPASVGTASKDNNLYIYLGPSVNAVSSGTAVYPTERGLHLTGIKETILPATNSIVNVYNNVTNTFVPLPLALLNNDAINDDDAREYTSAQKSRDVVRSRALVWQGYWFEGNVVPMVGFRRDSNGNRFVKAPLGADNAVIGLNSSLYTLPETSADLNSRNGITSTSAQSKTYSVVVHTPQWLRKKLPLRANIAPYFNQSENIQAQPGRVDVLGGAISNPKGETREYGVRISVLDDRLSVRWARYRTLATNISAPSIGSSQFEIGHSEAFGQASYWDHKLNPGRGRFASKVFGTASNGQPVTWRPDGPLKQSGTTYTYTQAELDATYAKEKAALDAWGANPVPQSFQDIWGLTLYSEAAYRAAFAANPNIPPTGVYSNNPGVTVTQDQVSRGDEFEVHGTVVRGWDVFLTASHVNAYRDNLAPSFVQWATQRWELFQGPAGDMRVSENFPGEGNSTDYPGQNGDTVRNLYKNVMANILFQLRSAGRTVSELKPWRFGAVTNYEFHEGKLKGLNFGGAYRWAAGNITGTPVKMEADGINAYFDVAHPYKGKSEEIIDLWMGYRWKFARHLRWRTQLNVRNAFATDKLIAVTVQPDGSPAGYKIAEPRTFTLTNTIEF
jgi:outer membrane receptor protein involved in Fe transport